MNLYLIFALALGAIPAAPVPQPQAANVIAARAERAIVRASASAVQIEANRLKPVLHRVARAVIAEVPLTGGAAPRAPARSC